MNKCRKCLPIISNHINYVIIIAQIGKYISPMMTSTGNFVILFLRANDQLFFMNVQMRFFLRLIPLLLRDHKSDLDETLGVYTVCGELLHEQIFNFRSEVQTGSWRFCL